MARIGFDKPSFGNRVAPDVFGDNPTPPVQMPMPQQPSLGNQQPIDWGKFTGPAQQPTLDGQKPIDWGGIPQLKQQQEAMSTIDDMLAIAPAPTQQQPKLGDQQPIDWGKIRPDTPSAIPTDLQTMIPVSGQGTVSLPPLQRGTGRTPEDIQGGVADQNNREALRRGIQEGKINEAKQGIRDRVAVNDGTKAAMKALEDQGMLRADIKKQLTEDELSTPRKVLSGLQRVQASRSAQGAGTDKRTAERFNKNSEYDAEGNPNNIEARGQEYNNTFYETGPDPDSDQTNKEYMTPGERRQAERQIKSMSYGTRDQSGERKLKNLFKTVEKRRMADLKKNSAKRLEETRKLALQKAVTAEQKAAVDKLGKEHALLDKELDGLKDQEGTRALEIQERMTEITSILEAGTAPAPSANTLTPTMAREFLDQAGGDRAKAEELARQQGYSF